MAEADVVTGAAAEPWPAAAAGVPPIPDFAEFYQAQFHQLTMQLYAHSGDLTEAQEVVQEAFSRAYARWRRIGAYDDPAAWVRRVAWNLATSRWRRLRTAVRAARLHREEHTRGPEPDRVALVAALATLPDRQRRIVVLHYYGDLPVAEIAAELGIPAGTVKSDLHRARAALACRLADTDRGGTAGRRDG
jgi:RNA polymerase sigma-70 factor (ECF subfamily)